MKKCMNTMGFATKLWKLYQPTIESQEILYISNVICVTTQAHTRLQQNLPEAILHELDVSSAGDSAGADVYGTHMLFSCIPQDVLQNSCLAQGHTEEVKQVHVWTKSSTKFFLEAYLVRAEKFRDPKIKKKILWTEIVAEIEGVGFVGVTEDAVDRKMRNLRKTYREIKDNNRKNSTGRGTLSWEYFEIFEEIFARDSTINFGATISSFKPVQVPPLTVPVPSPVPSPAASSSSLLSTPSAPASPTSPSSFFSESLTFPFVSDENSYSPNADRRKEKNKNSRGCYNLRKILVQIEEEPVDSIRTLTKSILENNNIQRERNELLRQYLSKH